MKKKSNFLMNIYLNMYIAFTLCELDHTSCLPFLSQQKSLCILVALDDWVVNNYILVTSQKCSH